MWKRFRALFIVPQEIRETFREDCIRKNRISLSLICSIAILIELFNMARVLFFSRSGLNTLNNRIYFSMYSLLLGLSVLYLLLQKLTQASGARVKWRIQMGMTLGLLLWHVALNTYDLQSNPPAEAYVFTAGVLGLSMFVRLPNLFMIPCIGFAGAFFIGVNHNALGAGDIINLTIMSIVAIGLEITQNHHSVVEICQRREIQQINERLQSLLEQDSMLNILNKSAMERRVRDALAQAGKDRPVAVFMIDMDNFKSINDRYGHPCGDYILEETAAHMRRIFRGRQEAIGRIGGDEFAVLLRDAPEGPMLEELGMQLIESVRGIQWNGKGVDACCSIGIVRIVRAGMTFERLYDAVDDVLYDVKQGRKGWYKLKEIG